MDTLVKELFSVGLVPVIKIDEVANALPLAKALVAGGIPVAEVTFRTAAAADAIRAMRDGCPDILVGAGTVINTDLAKKAVEAGARFIVSPGFNPAVVDWCREHAVPIVPGINSPSLIEAGLEKGLSTFKFFPAEQSGGVAMIDALAAPFPQVSFMPTGGIGANNVGDYARRSCVLAIGGSWMVKAELIANGDWAGISGLCRRALQSLHGFTFAHMGMNAPDADSAREISRGLSLFGFPAEEGTSSLFNGTAFEVMKGSGRGERGHIALRCNSVERALAWLETQGYRAVEETVRREKGRITVAYLDRELGGFALHLLPPLSK